MDEVTMFPWWSEWLLRNPTAPSRDIPVPEIDLRDRRGQFMRWNSPIPAAQILDRSLLFWRNYQVKIIWLRNFIVLNSIILTGKRARRPSDGISEMGGSKRARRDSSSSLGSSLSMEMPPLFQNGVVGQTTSHLVSRETDLSLGSLLSRNQTLFGHSLGHTGPMVTTSAVHSTAHAQSQTVTQVMFSFLFHLLNVK